MSSQSAQSAPQAVSQQEPQPVSRSASQPASPPVPSSPTSPPSSRRAGSRPVRPGHPEAPPGSAPGLTPSGSEASLPTWPDQALVVGVDFGTLSGRAVVVRAADGAELASATHDYEHAVMDSRLTAGDGRELPPDWALQDPADYLAVLQRAVPEALEAARRDHGASARDVVGLAVDATSSTVMPAKADGTPLAQLPGFANHPHAWVKLWKHHAAQAQADRLTELARQRQEPWLARYGGVVSSEWSMPKALQVYEEDREVFEVMDLWVEAADWIVWQLCGRYVPSACTVGYKLLYQDGRYPDEELLEELSPGFSELSRSRLPRETFPLGARAGGLSAQAAAWTGLPQGVAVAVANVDAHVTAPAAQVVDPGQVLAIMGTSTCLVTVSEVLAEVPGMSGVVDGGVVKGLWGYEAGQSGVGDIFAWFVQSCLPGSYHQEARRQGVSIYRYLGELAARQEVGEHGLLALDWQSGNRSVLADSRLSGMILGLTLQTRPEEIYRALVEATAFGARTIIEAYATAGVGATELVAAGGLVKDPFLMQVYCDVLGVPVSVLESSQGPALGAAIHAAVAAGCYPDVRAASAVMGRRTRAAYTPDPEAHAAYDALFAEYTLLHDYFGRGTNEVMHRLGDMRRQAVGTGALSAHAGRTGAVQETVQETTVQGKEQQTWH
ncbi:ribulokinase [Actinomyces sp. 2119]|uniref:ribulokinase n=1 Tax=Actinomyces sp. 2119 TaxID=2321393 RepID=UPI000E6D4F8B|nr:ribulokinase [Actinomyces sp. 2119]RJF40663.1 ribulokinase [Actinomyces sp. 2119]